MVPPDDDIPDLLPFGSRASPAQAAPRSALPLPAALRHTSEPPPEYHDPEPRPSRPVPGRDSGLELEMLEVTPLPSAKATLIAGTSDELEFDPTTIPPPDFDGSSRSSHPPSGRPPRRDASMDVSLSALPLDVPALDVPALEVLAVPSLRSAIQNNATSRNEIRPLRQEVLQGVELAAFPGMGNEVDLGDGLDELDFGGAAAAQLNVGVPEREEGDEVPWPTGRTPVGDALTVSAHEAEQMAGFGPAPTSFLQTPLYTLRVKRALGPLREKQNEAQKRLSAVEDARDEALAELASEKRSELQKNDRFAFLYSGLDKHEQSIVRRKQALQAVDVEGHQALRDVLASIDALNVERLTKAKVRDERRALMEEAERTIKRHQAALKRIQIEWRNIEARAVKTRGSEMPDELAAQLDVLEEQQVRARADLDHSIKQFKEMKKQLGDAENDVSIALSHVQAAEGKKEGLLIGYEGDIKECSRALDRAFFEKLQELANAGRAIVDLRGQVPVPASVRRNLLAADDRVLAAARHLELVHRAIGSMDEDAYGTGRAVWLAGFLVLVGLLVFSAL